LTCYYSRIPEEEEEEGMGDLSSSSSKLYLFIYADSATSHPLAANENVNNKCFKVLCTSTVKI